MTVLIKGKLCTDVRMRIPHHQIECEAPSGTGNSLIQVEVDGLGTLAAFTYSPPLINRTSCRKGIVRIEGMLFKTSKSL